MILGPEDGMEDGIDLGVLGIGAIPTGDGAITIGDGDTLIGDGLPDIGTGVIGVGIDLTFTTLTSTVAAIIMEDITDMPITTIEAEAIKITSTVGVVPIEIQEDLMLIGLMEDIVDLNYIEELIPILETIPLFNVTIEAFTIEIPTPILEEIQELQGQTTIPIPAGIIQDQITIGQVPVIEDLLLFQDHLPAIEALDPLEVAVVLQEAVVPEVLVAEEEGAANKAFT